MDRLEQVRQIVDQFLREQPDHNAARCGFVHLYGVSAACVLLARKRGLDQELCAVAGMLHDISSYKTGNNTDHARLSAVEAERILAELACFTSEEIPQITDAIARHSAKDKIDGPLAECLKDADVFQYYLYDMSTEVIWGRLAGVLSELGLEETIL